MAISQHAESIHDSYKNARLAVLQYKFVHLQLMRL